MVQEVRKRHVWVYAQMSTVTVDTSITINVEQSDGIIAVLTLTLEEARALKDELIRAIGAQNPVPVKRPGELYAPVITPKGGFINTDATKQLRIAQVPQHLLDRARAASEKAELAAQWVCHCGDQTGCRPGHCTNVPA
jgi:hypothetical protein